MIAFCLYSHLTQTPNLFYTDVVRWVKVISNFPVKSFLAVLTKLNPYCTLNDQFPIIDNTDCLSPTKQQHILTKHERQQEPQNNVINTLLSKLSVLV